MNLQRRLAIHTSRTDYNEPVSAERRYGAHTTSTILASISARSRDCPFSK